MKNHVIDEQGQKENEDIMLELKKMKAELARKDEQLGTLEDRLHKKEQAMTKQAEVIAQMSMTHAKQAETI